MNNAEARRFELSLQASAERRSSWNAALGEARRRLRIIRIEADCEDIPVNLAKLAKRLGIHSIKESILPMKGRIVLERDGPVVEVGSDLPLVERRFTVAHEVAHVIVEGDALWTRTRLQRTRGSGAHSNRLIEKLCDALATEILLPYEWIKKRVIDTRPAIDLVLQLASESEASVDVTATTLLERGLWNCRFFWWTQLRGYFRAIRSVPFLDEVFLTFVAPGNQRTTILRQTTERGRIVAGHDVVRFRNEAIAGRVECVRTSDREVFSLLDPERA